MIYPAGAAFRPGKLMEIHKAASPSIVCIASGAGVAEAVRAAKNLAAQGVQMSVWNAHSLKPFDDETTLQIAKQAKWIFTVEDHSVIGGLGSCVAEALATQDSHPRLLKLGVQDVFR